MKALHTAALALAAGWLLLNLPLGGGKAPLDQWTVYHPVSSKKHDLPIQGCMPRWDGRTPPSDSSFRALCPPYERGRVEDQFRSPYLRSGRRPAPQKIRQSGPTSRDRIAGDRALAVQLRRTMLGAGLPPARLHPQIGR